MIRTHPLLVFTLVLGALGVSIAARQPAAPAVGQGRGGRGQGPAQTPQEQAPIDLTGWWVSVVTEDWRWRMVTPRKGDYASVPINDEGRKVADAWEPATDDREGNACKAYGAAAIMRVPGRVHITWQDQNTLHVDTDAGTQTRLLHFADPPSAGEPSWQGFSKAAWEFLGRGGGPGGAGAGAGFGGAGFGGAGGGGGGGGGNALPPGPRYGSLKVVTNKMKAGYLRKNGVPYSDDALVTEYFDRHREQNGDQWFTVTTIVEDSKYLNQPFITTSHFKKEPDGSKWRPTPCTAQ